MKAVFNKSNPSAAFMLTVEFVKGVQHEEGNNNSLVVNNEVTYTAVPSILRFLARSAGDVRLYGETLLERTEVDHWLEFSNSRLGCQSEYIDALLYLEKVLGPVTYLVGHSITLADIVVWSALRGSGQFMSKLKKGEAPVNVTRYFNYLSSLENFKKVESKLPQAAQQSANQEGNVKKERKEEGKFIELPGAKMGEVVVRFPPEASGFLHVGHAKAALLNQYYQLAFKGKLIMRFDDTNPAKEDAGFEKVILEDVEALGLKPDIFTHTSDWFDNLLKHCEEMIKNGKAYVDDTDPETMKKERDERVESKNRSNSVEQNLKMWQDMQKGTTSGQKCGVRAKIDMKSDNGCMRDPIIYRCKTEEHVKTGFKYKVYPTYDFACPIVDSVEGVTHALRTTEYHDRDEQYYWFLEALGLRKPYIWEYSRLNLQNTVMSKRKLTWFVNEGLVEGWDDPRLPTVRGVLRRGMTIEGLKQFVIAQGSSRSINMMDWDKIWSFNKKVIDPVVPRYTALKKGATVVVNVNGAKETSQEVAKHPKNTEVGMKTVWYGKKVLVEAEDAELFKVGENVTFINWGNLMIKEVKRNAQGKVESIVADLNLDDKDYKKTMKVTWLTETDQAAFVPTTCITYDNIITKPVLSKEDDFKNFINKDSKKVEELLGDPCLASLKKGEIIQLQRKGYFICDSAYELASPCILLNIPDGHQVAGKEAAAPAKPTKTESAKEKQQSKKGKVAEKSPMEEHPPKSMASGDADDLNMKIGEQGNLVRKLKGEKAAKEAVDAAVKTLLALKVEYKNLTGKDWKPGQAPVSQAPAQSSSGASGSADEVNAKITEQGNVVRQLKSEKAPKEAVDAAVKTLLALKVEYKNLTGKEWKPGQHTPAPPTPSNAAQPDDAQALNAKINDQGNVVRKLKSEKAPKEAVDAEVKELLHLKAQYKTATGKDWKPGQTPTPAADTGAQVMGNAAELNAKINDQGNVVRKLKSEKAPKEKVDPEVKLLLDLKEKYKAATGQAWKPGQTPQKTGDN